MQRDLPSRAATPTAENQAFIEGVEGTDDQSSAEDISGSSTPILTDPPEYLDGMATPDLNFRIAPCREEDGRWSKWDKEGFGDQEKPNSFSVGEFVYKRKSAYPAGISDNYLGARVGKGNFPSIPISVAKQLLGFQDERSQDIYNNFIREVTAHLTIDGIERKTADPNAWRAVMLKITRSKHLAPAVRNELIDGPMDAETGELLWSQGRRCYWHAIDTIAQQQAKTIRLSLKLGRDQAKVLRGKDIRWR